MPDRVLTLPRRLMEGSGSGHLVWLIDGPDEDLVMQYTEWVERPTAEASHDMVQPIPCAVIVDSVGRGCVLERPVDARGAGRFSLVVGGHVEEADARESFGATPAACLTRELAEEVGLVVETPASARGRHNRRPLHSGITAHRLHPCDHRRRGQP